MVSLHKTNKKKISSGEKRQGRRQKNVKCISDKNIAHIVRAGIKSNPAKSETARDKINPMARQSNAAKFSAQKPIASTN